MRATTPDARLTLRLDPVPRLVLELAGPGAPRVVCELAGGVVPGTVRSSGTMLGFGLRPFPGVALSRQGELELDVTVDLEGDGTGVTIAVDGPADYPLGRLVAPGAFRLDPGPSRPWHFLIPLAEGLSIPADPSTAVRPLPDELDLYGDWVSLPLIALTDGSGAPGGSLLVTTPQGDDHSVTMLRPEGDAGPGFALVQQPTLGRFGYRRIWRIHWVARPGLVALAEVVRAELRAAGLALEALPSKLAARGVPDDLVASVGGTHLWWHVDPVPAWLPARLRQESIRSVVLLGRFEEQAAQAAREAGMVTGPYAMTSDIYPPGAMRAREWRNLFPPEGFTQGWPEQLARTREGWLLPNWVHTPAPGPVDLWASEEYLTDDGTPGWRPRAVEEFVPTQGYLRCPQFHEQAVRHTALPELDRCAHAGVFADVTTAAGAIECHAPTHPCDRRGDIALRRRQLELLGQGGRFVASECGTWWALDETDAFEGSLKYESHLNNRVLGDYPFLPEWWGTQFNLEHRVPLLGLVARHAVVRTHWWGHGHDRHAESWDAKDALCAVFGANPIFVADPAHPLEPGTAKWDRFLRTARLFDLLRRRTFGLSIRSYEVVSRHVAVTGFEDGTEVRANVGPQDGDGLAAGAVEVRDDHGRVLWPASA